MLGGLTTSSSVPTPVPYARDEENGYATGGARLGSGGEPVLVQQPAETVDSLDNVPTFEPVKGQVEGRRFEVDGAVRALLVVVGHEFAQHALGMAVTADEHPVQALGPGGPHKSFRERVRLRRPDRCAHDPGAGRPHHLVERHRRTLHLGHGQGSG